MTIVETERLIVRNWREEDRDLFFEINSDEAVMEFFPFRRDRTEADAFFDRIRALIAGTGLGFYALEIKETGEAIGFTGLARTDLAPHIPAGTVEIGWRLAARHWHRGFASEAAEGLLGSRLRDTGAARHRLVRRPRQPPLDGGDEADRHAARCRWRFRSSEGARQPSASEAPCALSHDRRGLARPKSDGLGV